MATKPIAQVRQPEELEHVAHDDEQLWQVPFELKNNPLMQLVQTLVLVELQRAQLEALLHWTH